MDKREDGSGKVGGILAPAPVGLPSSLVALEAEIAAARSYRARAKSANTRRAYDSDWRQFGDWCFERTVEPLPARPEVVATYCAALARAGRAPSTITRHQAAIAWAHRQAGVPTPQSQDGHALIADTLAGIRREQRARISRKKAAVSAADLGAMLRQAQGEGTRSIRDRAVLSLGLASALRRSELVALELRDVVLVDQGLRLTIRAAKADQEGEGTEIAVPAGKVLKPVAHLNAWLAIRGGSPGPLFTRIGTQGEFTLEAMSDRSVARLVKRYAQLAGLDAAQLGGHSLRAGFITEAARTRASIVKMQEVSRHKSVAVLISYVRSAELFDDHAGAGFL